MKLFDEERLKSCKNCCRTSVVVFVCIGSACLIVAVLSVVFWQKWGRVLSQILCSASISLLLCSLLFFVRVKLFFAHVIDICNFAYTMPRETLVGTAMVESGITTYRFLPFHSAIIHTEKGDECVYLQSDNLKEGVVYSFSVCQRIVCSFEELS